jgi:hypothetical protein
MPAPLNAHRPTWLRYIPPVGWLAGYRAAWLPSDLIAGVTLAAYAIPMQGLPACRRRSASTAICSAGDQGRQRIGDGGGRGQHHDQAEQDQPCPARARSGHAEPASRMRRVNAMARRGPNWKSCSVRKIAPSVRNRTERSSAGWEGSTIGTLFSGGSVMSDLVRHAAIGRAKLADVDACPSDGAEAQPVELLAPAKPTRDEFVSEQNISRFADHFVVAHDPSKRKTIQRLLLEQETRFGFHSEQLERIQQRITECGVRIAQHERSIQKAKANGYETATSERVLSNLIELQELYWSYHKSVLEGLNRSEL